MLDSADDYCKRVNALDSQRDEGAKGRRCDGPVRRLGGPGHKCGHAAQLDWCASDRGSFGTLGPDRRTRPSHLGPVGPCGL